MATTQRSERRHARPYGKHLRPGVGPDEFRYYIDRRGVQHFNFEQQLWLERSVAMAFTPVRTTALETLAINVLTLAYGGSTAQLKPLARDFCEQCLLGAPQEGWVLPRLAIQAWIQARRR